MTVSENLLSVKFVNLKFVHILFSLFLDALEQTTGHPTQYTVHCMVVWLVHRSHDG